MANTHQYEPPPQSAHTPLTIAAFYTLFALAQGEQHGYAIMQATKSLSAGAFSMRRLRASCSAAEGFTRLRRTGGRRSMKSWRAWRE